MRAVRVQSFGRVDDLLIEEISSPACGPSDVLIDVHAAGVNFADLLVAQGSYQSLPRLPFTLGMEAAGRVAYVGSDVRGIAVGAPVLAMVANGAFAEQLSVHAERAIVIPEDMPFPDAAAFGLAYSTAYFALVKRARLVANETVLVTGATGGVGHAAVMLAKALGATVIAVSRNVDEATRILGPAADRVVLADPTTLRDAVMDVTDGRGVDVVLDVVGGDLFSQLLRVVAWEGRAVIVGFASGGQNPLKPGHLLVKNIAVMGVQVTDYSARQPAEFRAAMTMMLGLYSAGQLPVLTPVVHGIEETSRVLSSLQHGEAQGTLVLLPTPQVPTDARSDHGEQTKAERHA